MRRPAGIIFPIKRPKSYGWAPLPHIYPPVHEKIGVFALLGCDRLVYKSISNAAKGLDIAQDLD
jgi:hypothetical protein